MSNTANPSHGYGNIRAPEAWPAMVAATRGGTVVDAVGVITAAENNEVKGLAYYGYGLIMAAVQASLHPSACQRLASDAAHSFGVDWARHHSLPWHLHPDDVRHGDMGDAARQHVHTIGAKLSKAVQASTAAAHHELSIRRLAHSAGVEPASLRWNTARSPGATSAIEMVAANMYSSFTALCAAALRPENTPPGIEPSLPDASRLERLGRRAAGVHIGNLALFLRNGFDTSGREQRLARDAWRRARTPHIQNCADNDARCDEKRAMAGEQAIGCPALTVPGFMAAVASITTTALHDAPRHRACLVAPP